MSATKVAKVAAEEAVEVGQAILELVRQIKGTGSHVGAAISYAANSS